MITFGPPGRQKGGEALKKDVSGDAFRANVTDIVFELMRDSILDGTWKVGEKIPSENKLTAVYGVSRVTVRAAIARLSSLGMLESRQGGGTFVCNPGVEQSLNSMAPYFAMTDLDRMYVFEFRKAIETGAVTLAAERADAGIIEKMRECSRKMEEATDEDEVVDNDMEFHRLIAEASGNPLFAKVFDVMYGTYRAQIKSNVAIMGAAGVNYHHMITHALQIHDKEIARVLMLRHLNYAVESTSRSLQAEADSLDSAREET